MRNILQILFLSVSFSAIVLAQSNSVYTRSGFGDLEYGYSAKMIGIGNIGTALLDPDHLIVTNPASWSALTRTRIEFGIGYRGTLISDNIQSNYTSETDFKGFTFGFPVSREYGIGVVTGLLPYSRVSYEAVKVYPAENVIPSYKLLYEGKGGLSKLFIGSSVFLPLDFSAGVTLDYYFGNQNYISTIEFDESDYINTTYENLRSSTGFGTTFGLISSNLAKAINLENLTDLRIGLAYNYVGNLNTDTLFTQTSLFLVDTVAISNTEMKIPARFTGGISFVLQDSYCFNLDYMFQPMSKYKFNNKADINLKDAARYSAAFEYKPKKSVGMTELEQMVWRFGLSYEQTQYVFNGKDINQFSVYGGFSYPLGIDNTLDLAIEYSNRGTTENNLLNENAIKIYLGISFGELWFLTFDK
ncbi:MAG: hypothetical protein WAU11_14920 [Ignavibacteriaceae bacterium]